MFQPWASVLGKFVNWISKKKERIIFFFSWNMISFSDLLYNSHKMQTIHYTQLLKKKDLEQICQRNLGKSLILTVMNTFSEFHPIRLQMSQFMRFWHFSSAVNSLCSHPVGLDL